MDSGRRCAQQPSTPPRGWLLLSGAERYGRRHPQRRAMQDHCCTRVRPQHLLNETHGGSADRWVAQAT